MYIFQIAIWSLKSSTKFGGSIIEVIFFPAGTNGNPNPDKTQNPDKMRFFELSQLT